MKVRATTCLCCSLVCIAILLYLPSANAYGLNGDYWSKVNSGRATITADAYGAIVVQWINIQRANAAGSYDATKQSGWVNFPDDRTYQFTFDAKTGTITWDGFNNIWYQIDISGLYSLTSGGSPEAAISVTSGGGVTVQFLNSQRPISYGNFNTKSLSGSVTFVDDRLYKLSFDPTKGVITWDSGNYWYRVRTVSMSGKYSETQGGSPVALVSSDSTNTVLTVQFLNSNRPLARGNFNPPDLSGSVTFPDDRTYKFQFNPGKGVINWDTPGNVWYRVSLRLAASSLSGKHQVYDENKAIQSAAPILSGRYSLSEEGPAIASVIADTYGAIRVQLLNSDDDIAIGMVNLDASALGPLSGWVSFEHRDHVHQFTYDSKARTLTWDASGRTWYQLPKISLEDAQPARQ